jgi:hypothetical protein
MGHLVLFKWNELSPFTESNQVLEIEARGQFLHAVQTKVSTVYLVDAIIMFPCLSVHLIQYINVVR